MRELQLLRKRVKTLWKMEEGLSPNERRLHQWQVSATQAGIMYTVGKGDANTFFYAVNGNDMKFVMPDVMLKLLDDWTNSDYVAYTITKKKDISGMPLRTSPAAFLKVTKDKYLGYYIVGIKSNGDIVRLHKLEGGLQGNHWVKFKGKKKR
jgi:hypothetical protein